MHRNDDYYWDKVRETRPAEQRQSLIFQRLKAQLDYVYEEIPFYRQLYQAHGVEPRQIDSLDSFSRRIPV
ncbi:MAG: phenylacetate--CoA ligase family protein, partial [Candidatus Thiodiazotropha weberae]|nr:phenylacetate--CoA ligase family protein [Candidatus Thiodiazotropha lotti]MCW4211263.1 phenylacetate--CoA ligase family protein [Candidatus Thiodiazotropha lotti]